MNNIKYTFIFGIIIFFSNIYSFSSGVGIDALHGVGVSATIILTSFLFLDYKINKRFSYAGLFSIILFLFHFGQLILFTYFEDIYPHIRFLLLLSPVNALYGFRIMLLAFSALCLGCFVKYLFIKSKRAFISNETECHYNWIEIAKRIIYLTFFVKLALDAITLYISFTGGGSAAREFVNNFPNVFLFYGKISLLGFALLLVALRDKPVVQTRFFVFIIAYILVMMMSGIRSENVGYLAVFLFIYLQSRNKSLKFSQILQYAVLGFFCLTFIVAVGRFRSYTNKSLDSFLELTEKLILEENVLLGLFDTCGDTGYTAQEAINEYLPRFSPSYGDAYYKGVFAVLPNLFPSFIDFGTLTEEGASAVKLQKSNVLEKNYFNIGGSFFAEIFMNFGIVGGVMFSFIWGLFFGWLSRTSVIAFDNRNLHRLLYMIPLMLATIYWVRSSFGGGIREAVWDILFGYLVIRYYKK